MVIENDSGTETIFHVTDSRSFYVSSYIVRRDAFRQAKRDAEIPYAQSGQVDRVHLLDGNGEKIKYPNGQVVTTRQYHYINKNGDRVVIQEHSWGHSKATAGHGAEPHFNTRAAQDLKVHNFPGTHGHYNFPRS
ncbi:HNH/endonuclease VII fold putative polymorphic toxin [Pseudomonas sp. Marseille-Q5115]|uniref:HNH/endonuclease VII fold putative polymorphic toxin n=1 Tax=Pseudomonas sp. Marseille-Q5115 TaxID=2866593 RepID=UPI001CE4A0AC